MIERFTPLYTSGRLLAYSARQAERFYSWEKRGRGWQTWDYAVDLEPPFERFTGHAIAATSVVDDARQLGLIRSLFNKNKAGITRTRALRGNDDHAGRQARPADSFGQLIEIQVALPPKLKINQAAAEQFLLSLISCKFRLALEIVGLTQSVSIQLACDKTDQSALEQQLLAYFPEAVLSEQSAFLSKYWNDQESEHQIIVEFGLASEFMRPLATVSSFDPDPLTAVVGALSRLRGPEVGLLQVLFRAARHPWAESMMCAVSDKDGRPFFSDAPDSLTLARQKVSRPLFAAVMRVAAKGASEQHARRIVRALGGAFNQLARPASNQLIPLSNEELAPSLHEADLLNRQTHRSGMILNSEELSCLVHLPSASLRSEKLVRDSRKKRPAPTLAVGHELILGENDYRGKKTEVTLSPDQRVKHTHIIGVSGTGKSTLVLNLALQDIKSGQGVGILDPHGDLIDKILGEIPEERHEDVILFDPSDEEFPIGFNILSAHSELEKNLLASDLVAVFRRLSTSWGDQMTSVLGNAVLAFLESDRGGTLADLKRFLVEADYRKEFLSTVADPEVVYYWTKAFPLLSRKPQAPLLTRLDTFLRPRPIRNMVTQKESRLDFQEIMNGRKILLAKLAQGAIGEQNSYLLGTLLVSKLHQLAMGRQEVEESARANFYLYIDEFQNFITPSMASILSGARKYHLALCLAHQEFRQMWSKDTDVASAVISNPYTRICFRLGDFDAKKLQHGFSTFEASDLQNLSVGEAIARIERNEYDFNLKTLPLSSVPEEVASQRRQHIIACSRLHYAQKRDDVEREFRNNRAAAVGISQKKDFPAAEGFRPSIMPVPRRVESHHQSQIPVAAVIPAQPLGRGGQQHKYLQQLIKRLAEDKGYRVIIEDPVLAGLGSVDVSLERNGRRIACEISVKSKSEYEIRNIQKCLAAGFDQIVMLSYDRRTLTKIQKIAAAEFDAETNQRVLFFLPEEFVQFLEHTDEQQMSAEKTVRGYRVKVKYKASRDSQQAAQRQAIAQVILQALKRLKDVS